MSLLKFDKFDIKLDLGSKYKAHKRCIKKELIDKKEKCVEFEKETLKEHIDLVYDYFLFLVKENKLESYLDKLFEQSILLLDEVSKKEDFANFVKYLFAKAVYWHDMGKVNPNFQVDKMDNNTFKNKKLSEGSNHSPLGAYLFINHSLQELYNKKWDENEIEIIESIIYLFGYFISKHHSSIYQSSEFNFETDIEYFLELFSIEKSLIQIHKDKNQTFSSIYDYIENNKDTLFLLSKSLFSLLIISDYYGTAQFMNYGNIDNLVYNNFGLIDKKFGDKIYEEFYLDKFETINGKKKQKTFNQSLKEIKNINIEFKELEVKSNKNLNILRNKLFLETRETLIKNITKKLFYIEAPTGAGKTNLSIMSAVEILKEDKNINKIFYVFPFTTLITQTYDSIKNVLNLNNNEIVQLHSKAKYNDKKEIEKDGIYGNEKTNFLDNQFMNYPISLLSHVKFFNILTGTSKDDNYIFHRLANSIVIIDEIQTYNPDLWSSIVYMIDNISEKFNIKFIIMSATLPKIGDILNAPNSKFISLVSNKQKYFSNPNFGERVIIETNTIKIKDPKDIYTRLVEESKLYQSSEKNKTNITRTIIEFITKKGADEFYKEAIFKDEKFFDEIFILSGTILEPRRREIITFLKQQNDKNVLLVTTQVVEAGVDIDMDIGFKEKSLIDSDEQLAGRINRNSSKEENKLFLFELENSKAKFVYKGDKRLKVIVDENVLKTKNFDVYYDQVISDIKKSNDIPFIEGLTSYVDSVKNLRFSEAHIKIIDMKSVSIFVPLELDKNIFEEDKIILKSLKIYKDKISGKDVFECYKKAVLNQDIDFTYKKIELKKFASILSKFTFSLADYKGSGVDNLKQNYVNEEFGYLVLKEEDISYEDEFNGSIIYTYKNGLDTRVLKGENVGMFI